MSIKKIQELTGFSYSTISRVLNGKAKEFRISDETRQSILQAASDLNHRPNILARSLRLKKTHTIGLIVSDIQNPFFGELAWRIEKLLREHGYSTILCNSNEILENEEFYLKVLVDRQVDGIIISPIHTEEWNDMEIIRKNTPIVLIDRIFFETDLPWVTSDNTHAAEEVVTTLVEQGFTKIAYLGGTPDTYINTVRYQGYRQAMIKHGLVIYEQNIVFQGYSIRDGRDMMQTLLDQSQDFDAVLCVNNLVFLGAMNVVQKFELKFNRDEYICLAAFDIPHYCSIFKRPLICANQNFQRLAMSAVSLIMNEINGNPRKDNQLVIPIQVAKHRFK
jgi:LacI family transcriptional regulator